MAARAIRVFQSCRRSPADAMVTDAGQEADGILVDDAMGMS